MPKQTAEHTNSQLPSDKEAINLSRRRFLKVATLAGGVAMAGKAGERSAAQKTWSPTDPDWAEHGVSGGLRGRNESRMTTPVMKLASRFIMRTALRSERHYNPGAMAEDVPVATPITDEIAPSTGLTSEQPLEEDSIQPPVEVKPDARDRR